MITFVSGCQDLASPSTHESGLDPPCKPGLALPVLDVRVLDANVARVNGLELGYGFAELFARRAVGVRAYVSLL